MTFSDSRWALWRCACLRGAGFPVDLLMKLASPTAARAADTLLEAEQQLLAAQQAAADHLNEALDEMSQKGEWGDRQRRKALLDLRSKIKAGKLPTEAVALLPETVIAHFSECSRLLNAKTQTFYDEYDACQGLVSETLRSIASMHEFKVAILWQNRLAYHTGIAPLFQRNRAGLKRDTKTRQREELVANYLQRYCAKNDTIGFFGPVGWASFQPVGDVVSCAPGTKLIAKRSVYFESWGIEELGKKIAAAASVKPWLTPICTPFLRMEADILRHPTLGSTRLTEVQAAVLRLCDGGKTTREIARRLMGNAQAIHTEDEVVSLLDEMARKGYIFLGFTVAVSTFPERGLRALLNRIEEATVRVEALSVLNKVEAARDELTAAGGDFERLDSALANLDRTFVEVTGVEPTRGYGQTYAARTLVYEDCVRDVKVNLGPGFFEQLTRPLSLLLTSARWFSYEAAKIFQRKIQEMYYAEVKKTGNPVVNAATLWFSLMPAFSNKDSTLIKPLLAEFKRRWERILSRDLGQRQCSFSSEHLRQQVEDEFAAPHAGWNAARYHSPDIMLLAASPDAISRDEYDLVLGEFHLGANTLGASLFFHQHPCPSSLIAAVESDFPQPRIIPVAPKEYTKATSRTNYVFASPKDYRVEFGRDSFAEDRRRALPLSVFSVEEVGKTLMVRARDGELRLDAVEFFSSAFIELVVDTFKVLLDNPHTPRTRIDRLIITREAWTFRARDCDLAFGRDEADRYLEIREWATSYGLPRFAFAKIPIEVKPVYIDFHSPIYANLFSRKLQQTLESDLEDDSITVTEMLPAPDQAWLFDAQGRRYTSEFRIVVLDRETLAGGDGCSSQETAA